MTRAAYDLVAQGFGPGASGPLLLTAQVASDSDVRRAATLLRQRVAVQPEVLTTAPPQISSGGDAAVLLAIPRTSIPDEATQQLVDRLREDVVPALERSSAMTVHVGGMTAAFVDQSHTRWRACRCSSAPSSRCRSCCCWPRSARCRWR